MRPWWEVVRPRDVAIEAAKNLLMAFPAVAKWRVKRGRTATDLDVDRYAMKPFSALRAVPVQGRSILEVGPGDHASVGMLALGAGAADYSALDRFLGDVGGPAARRFYARVAERAPIEVKNGWMERGVDPAKYPWPDISFHEGSLEAAARSLPRFDVVFSHAVLEHLSSPARAFKAMWALVKPGGDMVHLVDYGPHDRWLRHDNPLTFLAIPPSLWRAMGSNRGIPNRVRHPEMMDHARRAGFEVIARVTQTFSDDAVRRIARYVDIPDAALVAKEALIIGHRT
jgi:SAM-dependent methyltransferase